MNEIEIPYRTFLEVYQFQLINLISKIYDVDIRKAKHLLNSFTLEFNQNFYNKVVVKFIEKE